MSVSMKDYEASLEAFARRVPELLSRHAATARLARDVERLDVAGQLDRRFTLAVLGKMKAGKSTLLNALVGRQLAPIGTTETTATINWFDFGEEERAGSFWACWKQRDEPATQFPLSKLEEFVGKSEQAEATAYLRFFAPSKVLERVRIVDTPGVGSTNDEHENTTRDFIHAGRADAVLLVLEKVKETDTGLMALFERKSRIPGQGAYNTIAVIQKWEALPGNPLAEADRLADSFKQRLAGRVSEVLPVSGILAQFAADVPIAVMDKLAFIATMADQADLEFLTSTEPRFQSDRSGLPLSAVERKELYGEIRWHLSGGRPEQLQAWSIVAFVLRHAAANGIRDGGALKAELRKLSRLDELNELLEKRFFKIGSLIQAGSVLAKALQPCEQALLLLKDGFERRKELAALGDQLVKLLPEAPIADTNLRRKLDDYLGASTAMVHDELDPLKKTWEELYERVAAAQTGFRLLMSDIAQIEILGDSYDLALEDDLVHDLRYLFGIGGVETYQRLGLPPQSNNEALLARADVLQAALTRRKRSGAMDDTLRKMFEHAEDRLQAIFSAIDA